MTFVWLISGMAEGRITLNVRETSGAGFHAPLPACEATIVTLPSPVKVRVAPARLPGPLATAKLTGSPLDAVAAKATTPAVVWSGMDGKSIV